MTRRRLLTMLVLAALAACTGSPTDPVVKPPPTLPDEPPALLREFRGLWIATVANIDWPSQRGLSADAQRAELLALLDLARQLRMTAVVLQVRAAGDAIYASPLEPWSVSLGGIQGADPGWDPLAFAVTEAHRRGLELHAWFNPFRAGNASDTVRLSPQHLASRRPDLRRVVRGSLWFDPGEQEVQDHSMSVILDVVQRYDIDAVHMDDFFYPYPTTGTPIPVPFPDSATYARYAATAGAAALPIADWRRDNINRFVRRLYQDVKAAKAHMKVGISPFGIWRPGNPTGITGLDAWRDIYADSRHWLQQGWVDYLAPQLYWSIASTGQSFPALHAWWLEQNTMRRHVWPGLAAYRVADGTSSAFGADEIANQITRTRASAGALAGGGSGFLLYNATTMRLDRGGVSTLLRTQTTNEFALAPASPWIDNVPPVPPTLTVQGDGFGMGVHIAANGDEPAWWLIRTRHRAGWTTVLSQGGSGVWVTMQGIDLPDRVRVHAVDRALNVSEAARWP